MDENLEQNKPINNQISIEEEKSKTIAHKDSSLKRLDTSFNKHIELGEYKKSNLLAYWIEEFSEYHDNETTFDYTTLKTFKRGDIIKANLGFNIGKELGGLHYCIVLNKKDNPYNGTLNVIPLSSAKKSKVFNSYTCIDLEDELYNLLVDKLDNELSAVEAMLTDFNKTSNTDIGKLSELAQKTVYLRKFQNEINKLKHGSFALVHQITTISKQRIFKTSLLSKISLSDKSLSRIDAKIHELFMK